MDQLPNLHFVPGTRGKTSCVSVRHVYKNKEARNFHQGHNGHCYCRRCWDSLAFTLLPSSRLGEDVEISLPPAAYIMKVGTSAVPDPQDTKPGNYIMFPECETKPVSWTCICPKKADSEFREIPRSSSLGCPRAQMTRSPRVRGTPRQHVFRCLSLLVPLGARQHTSSVKA